MPDKPSEIPWDDASDADRAAVMEMWWTKVRPEPGSDAYFFLQWMSGPGTGHGDPEAAQKELIERGLFEPGLELRSSLTETGRAIFFRLYEMVYQE